MNRGPANTLADVLAFFVIVLLLVVAVWTGIDAWMVG